MENTNVTTKVCTKCGTRKPISDFNKRTGGKYGVSSRCKECANEYSKEYHAKKKQESNGTGIWPVPVKSTNEDSLSKFSNRQLLEEIKRRGYRMENGRLVLVQAIDWSKI